MKERIGTATAVAGAAIVLASALVMGVLLASLSAPAGFGARLAALGTQAEEAKRATRPSRASEVLATDAACPKSPADRGETMRGRLAADAAALGMSVTRLEVAPQSSALSTGLTPLLVRVDASGSYDAALGMLGQLDKLSPQVFADSVDLVSKTSSVTLSFTGRAFCGA